MMIEGSTSLVTFGNLPSPFGMAKFPVRSLLSVKQKRLIIASATVSTPPTTLPPSSAADQSPPCALESVIRDEISASFFNLFRDYGFDDPEIEKLSESRVGRASVRNLKPKLECLVENGFTGELLHKLIVSSPHGLLKSLDAIKLNFQILKQYLGSNEKVVTAINRYNWILHYDLKFYLIPNIELLIKEGVPVDRVSKLLLVHPGVFMRSRDRMADAVKTVKEFGIAPDAGRFTYGLRVVCGFSESNLKKKLQVFKSFGWSDEQVSKVFKTTPACFTLSEENLRSKMWFFLDTLELEPETVIANPVLLGYSVERIRARYEVLKILKSNKLIRGLKIPLASGVRLTEDQFLERYVVEHEASVPGLLDMYYGILNQKKKLKGKKLIRVMKIHKRLSFEKLCYKHVKSVPRILDMRRTTTERRSEVSRATRRRRN